MPMPVLKAGGLACYETISCGLVPCKVEKVSAHENSGCVFKEATFTVTASRGPYKRGEVLTVLTTSVVPRAAVRRRKYGTYILPYNVELT